MEMSDTSVISSYLTSYGASTANSTTSTSSDNSTLTMDDFISLLVAQMKNQDMYNTMDSAETIAQMAQFSMVSALSDLTQQVQVGSSFSLVGKGATVTTDRDTVSGVIDGVTYYDGSVEVVINGTGYPIDDVTEVFDADLLDS